ncbi:flagellar biosynthesis protein FlaG [Halovibrio salipaludis]|uniref:Flagellar biosynthesis protein FlaG n=1 Tax=Halovibrio salipaludis TaxID=2032626 RepID=A0A2A2F5W4_9GAMM|nr:flagellar protein FlaG [Halovibrio salipaludis]PAU80190.1 flagellar biosynthesis protein FlaG [Halovibrio salipaludis]
MSDVNLNSPDPARRPAGEQGSARASSSSQPAENKASREDSVVPLRTDNSEVSKAEKTEKQNEAMREELDKAVSQLNDFVQSVQRDLEFEVNDETGQTVVRVIDQQTEEVVRQIPDELAVKLAENLQQEEPLSLLNIRV